MNMKALIFVVVFLACSGTFADGGKNRKEADVTQPDSECVYILPPGVEDVECSESQGISTSGLEIFTCIVTVGCFTDEDDDDR